MVQDAAWYVAPDGRLDLEKFLGAFQEFFPSVNSPRFGNSPPLS